MPALKVGYSRDMSDAADLSGVFPRPLAADPAVVLKPERIRAPGRIPGPVHGVQYVVEIAGPRTLPASAAHSLLASPWYGSLGEPEIHVMAPSDTAWRPMATSDGAGSYDSLALAWDFLTAKGNLSSSSATHLRNVAEQFGQAHGRRAFAFPEPSELDKVVRGLIEAKAAFDIGVEIVLQGPQPVLEREIWPVAAALGMDLDPEGGFVWRISDWLRPILTLAPYEEGSAFSLRGVQSGADFDALSLGFNLPTSPDPPAVLEALFHVADTFSARLGLGAFDEEGRLLNLALRREMASNLDQAIASMDRSGFRPGSTAAMQLFQ